jgi:hypothetical protein
MYEAKIYWPSGCRFEEYSNLINGHFPHLVGGFSFVDSLNLLVQVSSNQDVENVCYNGWLHAHMVSNILAFPPSGKSYYDYCTNVLCHILTLCSFKGEIIHCSMNAPGSWHDSCVAFALYKKLQEKTPAPYFLITDTVFPQTACSVEENIRVPLKDRTALPWNHLQCEQLLQLCKR